MTIKAGRRPFNPDTISGRHSNAVRQLLIGLQRTKLPQGTARAINGLQRYLDKPHALKRLDNVETTYRSEQRRVRIREVRLLTVLLSFMDWSTLRLGVAKRDALDPVKHCALRHRYEKVFGEPFPESSWFRYIDKLIRAGYLSSVAMNLKNGEGQVRGVAGYKWLTAAFFRDLGFKAGQLDDLRAESAARLRQSGLSPHWPVYESKTARRAAERARLLESYQTLMDGLPPPLPDVDPDADLLH